jgi:hypothetical protein
VYDGKFGNIHKRQYEYGWLKHGEWIAETMPKFELGTNQLGPIRGLERVGCGAWYEDNARLVHEPLGSCPVIDGDFT